MFLEYFNLTLHRGRQQQGHHVGAYSPPPKYPPRIGGGAPPFEEEPYAAARSLRYRELPPHRMPHFEDEIIGDKVIFGKNAMRPPIKLN